MSRPDHQPDSSRRSGGEVATREGYALVVNALITSAVGFGFWILAARRFSEDEVGIGSSLVNVIVLLSSVMSLNTGHALQRLLPIADRKRVPLILGAYAISVVTAVVLAFGVWLFALLPSDVRTIDSWMLLTFLVVGAGITAIFQLQDSAFIGLRSSGWVLVENSVYSVVKFGLLFMLLDRRGSIAIVIATIGGIPPAVFAMNWLLFRRLRHKRFGSENDRSPALGRRALSRFLAGDTVAVLSYLVASLLLTSIVAARRSAAEAAFFAVPWMIYSTTRLVAGQMAAPIVVDAAINPTGLWVSLRRNLVRALGLTAIGGTAMFVAAPIGLRIFGESYSRESTGAMRVLAIATVPAAFTAFGWAVQRIHGATRMLVGSSLAVALIGLPLVFLLLPSQGIAGAAIGWLVAESVAALLLLPATLRALRPPNPGGPGLRVLQLVTGAAERPLAARSVGALTAHGNEVVVVGGIAGAEHFDVPYDASKVLDGVRRRPLRALLAIARAIRAHRPDVVHAYAIAPAALARLATVVNPSTAVVVTTGELRDGRERRVARALRAMGAGVLVGSFHEAQRLHDAGLPREQVYVAPVGSTVAAAVARVGAGASLGRAGSRHRVLGVGSLDDVEGWTTFVDTIAHLDSVTATVFGDGPFRSDLERYAGRIEAPVRFVSISDDVVAEIRKADVVLVTSRSGTTATIARSAALLGVPTVLTRGAMTADLAGLEGVSVSPTAAPATVAATVTQALGMSRSEAPAHARITTDGGVPAQPASQRVVRRYIAALFGEG